MYYNTLVNERKHKDAKSIAKTVTAGTAFDRSVLVRMLCHQVQGLTEDGDRLDDDAQLRGKETDVTDTLGLALRPHCTAAQVIAGTSGPLACMLLLIF